MNIFNDHAYYSTDVIRFLINGIQLFFDRKNENLFKLFLDELQVYSEKFDHTKGKIIVDLFKHHLSDEKTLEKSSHLIFVLEQYDMQFFLKYL